MIKIETTNLIYESDHGRVIALKDVNLTIREGEFIAIMGPNGSGKTSLVRCLNALLLPSSGKITVDDLDTLLPENHLAIRKKVGMVFQNPDNQIVSTSIEREIAFGLENLGVPTETMHQIVDTILAQFHLEHYRQHPPHLLSGGEKQRLALASVLAMNPKYLVLDEPTSMLDPQGREELLQLLQEIKSDNARKKTTEQITIIFVTQFPEEAELADRLLIMNKGEIAYDDPPDVIFQNVSELETMDLHVPLKYEILQELANIGIGSDVFQQIEEE